MTVGKLTFAASTEEKAAADPSAPGFPKAAVASALAVWIGGAVAWLAADDVWRLGGVAVASALMGWAALRLGRSAARPVQVTAHDAEELARHIVPVWQRDVEPARQESERNTSDLLESFANVSSRLDRHRTEIERLCQTTRRAARVEDAMSSALADAGEMLSALTALADEVQTLGRATHVLALNALDEAARAGAAGDGFAIVAQEVRRLAGQSCEAGLQIGRRVLKAQTRIYRARLDAARFDTDAGEILRRSEAQSPATVIAVPTRSAEPGRPSRTPCETHRAGQPELGTIPARLPSQDRVGPAKLDGCTGQPSPEPESLSN